MHAALFQWDMQQAFDLVNRRKLWEAVELSNFPMEILQRSLTPYDWPRHCIGSNNILGEQTWATRGIGPGSPHATHELQVYLAASMLVLKKPLP